LDGSQIILDLQDYSLQPIEELLAILIWMATRSVTVS
jgi:hypothetical protein